MRLIYGAANEAKSGSFQEGLTVVEASKKGIYNMNERFVKVFSDSRLGKKMDEGGSVSVRMGWEILPLIPLISRVCVKRSAIGLWIADRVRRSG